MTEEYPNQTVAEDMVYALAVSPNFVQNGICYAARYSGLYRSEDFGKSWVDLYVDLNPASPLSTMALALSPDFETDPSVFAGVAGGILRSMDGGSSWNAAFLPNPPPLVSSLVISPNFLHDGVLLAGTVDDGVYRTANRGHDWAPWKFGLLDLSVFCLAISPNFANDETLYAGTESGLFCSTNGGRAWKEVTLPVGFEPVLSLAISPCYAKDGVLFAGTEAQGLLFSNNHGTSWTQLGQEIMPDALNAIIISPDYPNKPDLLVLHDDALFLSHDGGQSWSSCSDSLGLEEGIVSVVAPQGLDPGAMLLLGLVESGVSLLNLPEIS